MNKQKITVQELIDSYNETSDTKVTINDIDFPGGYLAAPDDEPSNDPLYKMEFKTLLTQVETDASANNLDNGEYYGIYGLVKLGEVEVQKHTKYIPINKEE